MKTKFNELSFRTSVLEEMIGKYLGERVLRSWTEDFADEDTGNIVQIQRNEILFERGTLLDNDALSKLNFYLQSGDVSDVLVSDQKRTGIVVKSTSSVYCVTILDGKKKRNYYLYANSVGIAMNIITDYLEQKITGGFSFLAIKEIGFSNLIPVDENLDEEEALDKDFYKIEIEIVFEESDSFEQIYVLQSHDAEEAKELIIRFISLKMKEEDRERPFEVTILSARTIPCNNIVDYLFSKEYFENQ